MSAIQDFESLAGNYEEAYDSARDFAQQRAQLLTQQTDLKGSELLNLGAVSGLSIVGKAITKAGIAGKITQTLDDFQGKMGPVGQRAFKIARQVGSNVLGEGTKLGEYTAKLGLDGVLNPKPKVEVAPDVETPSATTETPATISADTPTVATAALAPESSDDWKVNITDDLVPVLRGIGQNELASRIDSNWVNDQVLPKGDMQAAQSALRSAGTPESQRLLQKMANAKQRAALERTGAPVPKPDSAVPEPVAPLPDDSRPVATQPSESVGGVQYNQTFQNPAFDDGGLLTRPTSVSALTPEQAVAAVFGNGFGRTPVQGDEITPADPVVQPASLSTITEPTMLNPADVLGGIFQSGPVSTLKRVALPGLSSNNIGDAFNAAKSETSGMLASLKSGAAGLLSSGLGLAAGQLSGKAGQATGLAGIGLQSASELANGDLPAGALLMGVDAGLGRLGAVGARAAQGLNLGVTAGQVGQAFGQAANAVRGAVGGAEQAATSLTAGEAPATASGAAGETGLLATVGSAVDAVAGEGTASGALGALETLTAASAAGDEDPLGVLATGVLGLATGLTAAGEGIKDLLEHHRQNVQMPSLPSFQAGIVG